MIVKELEEQMKRLQGLADRFALKEKGQGRLLAEVRNLIMTLNAHCDDERVRQLLGSDSWVREALDFILIEHDARKQGRSVDAMRNEWETRYAVDGRSVDSLGCTWEHMCEEEAA